MTYPADPDASSETIGAIDRPGWRRCCMEHPSIEDSARLRRMNDRLERLTRPPMAIADRLLIGASAAATVILAMAAAL